MAKQTIALGTPPTGVGGDTPRSANVKINANFDEVYARHALLGSASNANLGTASGNAMPVGAFGLGTQGTSMPPNINVRESGFMSYDNTLVTWSPTTYGVMITAGFGFQDWAGQLFISCSPQSKAFIRGGSHASAPLFEIYTTGNTTRAADGTLKAI